ncbi:MAG TPA: Cof-type HAD-IIB family hydrolase [Nocardioides sp.]
MTALDPTDLPDLPVLPDGLRLAVVDMDGTLLDARGEVPDALWPLLDRLAAAGVAFAPASGRQYATLRRMFDRAADGMVFIAENGALVMRDGQEVSSTAIAPDIVTDLVRTLRDVVADRAAGVVLCGKRAAYVEDDAPAFLAEVDRYYASRVLVEGPGGLDAVDDDIVKVAVHDAEDPQVVADALAGFAGPHQVVVSGAHWVDVMVAGVHKGAAVRRLQEALGVTRAQTAAFGDYLNDLEMLDEAAASFAMAGAHPAVKERAAHLAPAHTDAGVVRVLEALLDRLAAR